MESTKRWCLLSCHKRSPPFGGLSLALLGSDQNSDPDATTIKYEPQDSVDIIELAVNTFVVFVVHVSSHQGKCY
jgi:hypothetical protein